MNGPGRSAPARFWGGLALLLAPSLLPASEVVRVEQRVEIDLFVPRIQMLDVNHAVLTAPIPQVRDFDRGYFEFSDPIWVTVSSNIPWELAVRRPPGDSTPSSLKTLQLQNGTRTLRVANPWQTLARGEMEKKTTLPFRIRIPLSWAATTPGSYEPQLEYRLGPDRAYP